MESIGKTHAGTVGANEIVEHTSPGVEGKVGRSKTWICEEEITETPS